MSLGNPSLAVQSHSHLFSGAWGLGAFTLILANNPGMKVNKREAGGVTEAGQQALAGQGGGKEAIAPFQPRR